MPFRAAIYAIDVAPLVAATRGVSLEAGRDHYARQRKARDNRHDLISRARNGATFIPVCLWDHWYSKPLKRGGIIKPGGVSPGTTDTTYFPEPPTGDTGYRATRTCIAGYKDRATRTGYKDCIAGYKDMLQRGYMDMHRDGQSVRIGREPQLG